MTSRRPWFAKFSLVFCLFAGANTTVAEAPFRSPSRTFLSDDRVVEITSDFPGGRMTRCEEVGQSHFAITISPEVEPINDSAWYAFQVRSKTAKTVLLQLRYVDGTHRYAPKTSRDGQVWESGDHLVLDSHRLGREITMRVRVGEEPLWIAGQELLSRDEVLEWSDRLDRLPYVEREEIGRSVEGRTIHQMKISETNQPDYVYLIARQHPPEVSGAIGMMHFVDTLAGSSQLARSFRKRYACMVVPTMNPDGVYHGHWRCNANGVDLNRDWYRFTQPETRAVRRQMTKCQQDKNGKLCLFVDFHSTFDDVFYTPPRTSQAFPQGFTDQWLDGIRNRFPNYTVNVDDNHNAHRSTSKAWVDRTLGVTAVTYEFGDETSRETIKEIASGAAEEMMRLLLQLPETSPSRLTTDSKIASSGSVLRD